MTNLSELSQSQFDAKEQANDPGSESCGEVKSFASGSNATSRPLRILQFLRAPVGGLFRHVCDLSTELSRRGHAVGVLCDASAAGSHIEAQFAALAPHCALGIHRIPLRRQPGLADLMAVRRARAVVSSIQPDVVHGHGAKGGALARLAGMAQNKAGRRLHIFYTPHGGSLHYDARSLAGRFFLGLEKQMAKLTDGLIFESAFSLATYSNKVGRPRCPVAVIHNGLRPEEFAVRQSEDAPADFVFVGELRHLKGVEVLLRATAVLSKERDFKVAIVGRGPDGERFQQLMNDLGLTGRVVFYGELPVRQAFSLGRCLVVPSLAESLPYIVLEGGAAGLPMILTAVGGIPEIVEGGEIQLLEPDAIAPLAEEMQRFLQSPEIFRKRANWLQQVTRERFSVEHMVEQIEKFYCWSLEEAQGHNERIVT
jgi:glycosyltransferase involved in cell wall biosynthesis